MQVRPLAEFQLQYLDWLFVIIIIIITATMITATLQADADNFSTVSHEKNFLEAARLLYISYC